MSNLETRPDELVCAAGETADLEVLDAREVPLGGPRAMRVRRTLPQRSRSLIGAWCFLDHYGPDDIAATGGMVVPPHPHTGLATVSWLFSGEVQHRDSAGNAALVVPGELNLMTAGRGISHSEVSTSATSRLHGVQLWLALPEASRGVEPSFVHHAPPVVRRDGLAASVFLGSLLGETSPVATHTPLLGAELTLEAGALVDLPVDPSYELGVLVDAGGVSVAGTALAPNQLGYLAPGRDALRLEAGPERARLLLLGGPPFGERIVMWWNFVGRDHDEVVASREAWQAQLADGPVGGLAPGRFGVVPDETLAPLPAPELPTVRLRSRP